MPRLIIAALAAFLAFLEARAFEAPLIVELAFAVAWSLAWTSVATLIARRLRPTTARAAVAAVAVALAGAMLLAPGLILHLMFGAPADYLALQQSQSGASTVAYYATLNPLTEWVLVPLALYLAWPQHNRRRPLLIIAALYYLERVATYLYFAPAILSWPNAQTTPALLDEVALWLQLDWARIIVDAATMALFALAAVKTAAARPLTIAATTA